MANQEQVKRLLSGVEDWNSWRSENQSLSIDLTWANLRKVNLRKANLNKANLTWANLSEADLNGADLRQANLTEANLTWANLRKAKLENADLDRAKLYWADLNGADLKKANLAWANFYGANLNKANLNEANLNRAKLYGAALNGADLRKADLTWATLDGATLDGADLRKADLTWAALDGATLYKAYLNRADLKWASFNRANLKWANFNGAVVNAASQFHRAKGVIVGVNGLYSRRTNSVAITTLEPPPDSMQGSNPDAVVESLKRARRLHSFSFGLAALSLAVPLLSLTEITLPFPKDLTLTPKQFSLIGLLYSAGSLMLVKTFLEDALDGARYIQDRTSAMKVGSFPWSLSRYAGKSFDKRAFSLLFRLVLAYHPIAYAFLPYDSVGWYHWVLGIVLLVFCTWIFLISQQFQRPILFDPQAEVEQKSELALLGEKVDRLYELLDKKLGGEQAAGNT